MRFQTTLMLALAVLAAAAVLWVYKDRLGDEALAPETPEAAATHLLDIGPNDVGTVTLEARGKDGAFEKKLALQRTGDAWRLTAPVDAAADTYAATHLAQAMADATFHRALAPGEAGQPTLESLGLESPAYRWTVVTTATPSKPAQTFQIDLGRKPPLAGGVYVRLQGPEPRCALLDQANLLDLAEAEVRMFRNRGVTDLRGNDLARIEIAGPEGGKVRLDRGEDGTWVLAEPAGRADPDAVEAILREIPALRVQEFVADAPGDLERYGLATPRAEVTLWKNGEPKKGEAAAPAPVKAATLRFGSWADIEKKAVHLTTDDGQHVVAVAATVLETIEKTAEQFRDRHVLAPLDASKIVRITLKNETGEFVLAKTGGRWHVQVAGRPEADADATAIEDLLREAVGLKVLYFADEPDAAAFDPPQEVLRLQVEGEPKERGFEIGGKAESRVLARNVRETWIGRINENDLVACHKAWFAFLDKEVLKLDPERITAVAVATPDRTVELARKDGVWRLVKPIEAEPRAMLAQSLAEMLGATSCLSYVAATTDYKPYGLETGDIVCTVTATGKAEAPPTVKVLRLATQKDAKLYGRVDGEGLVFEVPESLRDAIVTEPLAGDLGVGIAAHEVTGLDLASGNRTIRFVKVENRWYQTDAAGRPDREATGGDALEGLAAAVCGSRVTRWAAYDAESPQTFGLKPPALSITVRAGSKAATLLVSDREVPQPVAELLAERPLRYAMIEGGERIAILGGATAEKVAAAKDWLRDAAAK